MFCFIPARTSSRPEFNRGWKETKNWIKSFLKKIPPNDLPATLSVYNAYARVELEAGHKEQSLRILLMLLQMNGTTNPLVQEQQQLNRTGRATRLALIHVWSSYIRLLLFASCDSTSRQAALAQLVSLAVGSPFSPQPGQPGPASLLKAKKKFQSLLELEEDEEQSQHSVSISHSGLFHQPDEELDVLLCSAYFFSLTEGCIPAHRIVQQWLDSTRDVEMDTWSDPKNRFDPKFLT